jgi:hypothetical protein
MRADRGCIVLEPSVDAMRGAAVELLARPEAQVGHLINRPLTGAEELAGWLRRQRAAGRLTYQRDAPELRFRGLDQWCGPAALLLRRVGDCEDFALLAVALARVGGLRARVAVRWRTGALTAHQAHAWVEGEDARGRWTLEATTGELWRPEAPDRRLIALL